MGVKIDGINLDDLAKIDGKDIITAGDALVGEVRTGKTFYAGSSALLTGSGTQTLNPANENVPAGYYALTTLSAVDAQLAIANILSGINIFGFTGPATVQEIGASNALVGEVKQGVTFFSVTGAIKTGTMPTVAIVAGSDAYPVGYHAGDAGGLDAIDTDLAPANIAVGTTIFGHIGTHAGAPAESYEWYYTADLAASAYYTPGVSGFFSAALETEDLETYLQGVGWQFIHSANRGSEAIIGDGTNLRYRNADGANARNIVVMRLTITGATFERYYSADIAADSFYTPSDEGLFSVAGESYDDAQVHGEYNYNGSWWPIIIEGGYGISLLIGDGTNFRIHNDFGSPRTVVAMRYVLA